MRKLFVMMKLREESNVNAWMATREMALHFAPVCSQLTLFACNVFTENDSNYLPRDIYVMQLQMVMVNLIFVCCRS